jgi:xylulokinase
LDSGTGNELWIGVDAGTSGCKAVAVTTTGGIRAADVAGYQTSRHSDGRVTQDARDWVAALRSAVRSVTSAIDVARVQGMSVTAPAHNAVLVNADGQPSRRVLLWSDSRPAELAETLRARYGDEFFDRTFVRLGPGWTLPQLAWLIRHNPHAWDGVRHVLVGKDYLRYVLTGEPLTDPTDAAGTGMYDPVSEAWLDDVCVDIGLSPGLLPRVAATDADGGRLTNSWATELGLPAGLPVAVGATDTAAELVSVGATSAGSALVKVASTATMAYVADHPMPDQRLLCYPHAVPGNWYTMAATNTAATARTWLCRLLGQDPADHGALQEFEGAALDVPPGSDGLLFLPFLEGERTPYWDERLRSAFVGLSSAHTPAHCLRAVLEGVAYGLRTCRDVVEGIGGSVVMPVLTGGGLVSPVWRSILLSVLGRPGRLVTPCGPALGAAMLAGAAAGASLQSFAQCREVVIEQPRASWQEAYDAVYPRFAQLVAAISDFHQPKDGATPQRSQAGGAKSAPGGTRSS